ncbi:pyridoxal phosphate-dependent aminotransferase, partial [Acidihalobacter prosperus]
MSHFWSKLVRELTPYTPGEQPRIENLIKLNTNENPYPPSPKVHEAVCSVSDETWRLYPDPDATELKLAIAEHFDLPVKSVFVGNGSDEVLAHTFHALLKHEKPILFPDVTYSFYPVYCRLYDIAYRSVALNQQLGIEPEDYGSENGGIIFPNPNAPTGGVLSLDGIRQILERNPESVVVVDEAYIDFGGVSASILVSEYPNL